MSLPVVIRPEAVYDAEGARDYLESQQANLGQAFLARLNEVIRRIGAQPELYGVVWRNVRAVRLRQFVYVVYYRVQRDRVEILAVLHGSRDTSARQARI